MKDLRTNVGTLINRVGFWGFLIIVIVPILSFFG